MAYHGEYPVFHKGVPVRAYIEVTQPIPKSFSNTKHIRAAKGEIVPTSRNGDLDNIAKSILDALNGYVYDDDCQVVTLIISKKYGDDPCAVVRFENL